MNRFPAYASVVLDNALDHSLEYGILPEQIPQIQIGCRVEVPLRSKYSSGFVIEIKESSTFTHVKPIQKVMSDRPLITPELLQLSLWMMRYYCTPLGSILKMILPPGVRKIMAPKEQLFIKRGKSKEELREFCIEWRNKRPGQVAVLEELLQVTKGIFVSSLIAKTKAARSTIASLEKQGLILIESVQIDRSPLVNEEYFKTQAKKLNSEQEDALAKIEKSLLGQHFETHLLYGVTGSGKTEVYLQAIEKALSLGKGAIMLVPEISLTAQTIERFLSRFQEKIAILHHRLSQGERNDEWQNIHQGRAKIVIGARSAIFSPIQNLGLIIVDEEHEQSYKQNETYPCYQARDVAVMRGKMSQCPVILGSATPSFESYYNAQTGKYQLSVLNYRAAASLPQVTIVDMRKEYEKSKGFTNFSDRLLNAIKKRQEVGEQSILFLNRRGYHTVLFCPECQSSIKCSHCDIPLTFHYQDNFLSCHLCAFQLPPPKQCPSCNKSTPLKFRGVGTELVEKSLKAIFPDVRTIRLDADTTKHKGSHQKLLKDFKTGKADVLIGTQMIAKGLHMPEVTLVGVLNCDASLNIPDFRASEVAFQLITQVAGRSGRGALPGEVIIQTNMPDNSTIKHAASQDYVAFYKEEIAVRELFNYPPFTQLVKIIFSGTDAQKTLEIGESIRKLLIDKLPSHFELHPVLPCGYAKIKDKYRFQFLVRASNLNGLHAILSEIKKKYTFPNDVRMLIDVNPSSTYF